MNISIADIVALLGATAALIKVFLMGREQRVQAQKIEVDVIEKYKAMITTSTEEFASMAAALRRAERKIIDLEHDVDALTQRVVTLEQQNNTLTEALQEAYRAIQTLLDGIDVLLRQLKESKLIPQWEPPRDIKGFLDGQH